MSSIKFLLQRKSGTEVRRIRGDFTFPEIQSVMTQWWDSAVVKYQYKDSEGDIVTISSPMEWVECLRIHEEEGIAPVRIVVSKVGSNKGGHKNIPAPDIPAPEVLLPEVLPQPELLVVAKEVKPLPQTSAWQLMTALLGCEEALKLFNNCTDVVPRFQHLVTVNDDDVRVNTIQLVREASNNAVQKLKAGQYNAARALMHRCMELPVDDIEEAIVMHYNYACSLALTGSLEEACNEIEAAIGMGYRDQAHLSTDPDFNALHGIPKFEQLVASIAPKKVSPAVSIVDEPIAVPAVPIAVSAKEPVDPKVETLIAMFPGLDEQTATDILRHAGGNTQRAVEMFLGA